MTSSPETPSKDRVPSADGRRRGIAACAGALAAVGGAALAYRLDLVPGAAGAPAAHGDKYGAGRGERLPDLPLITHDGRAVRFYSDLVRGRVVFLNMMYAQCNDRCPPMTQNLRAVQEILGDRVGRDIFMYSITLLPEHDRPADLRAYRDLHGVGPGWTFLTGSKADVERLRFALGFFDLDPRVDEDLGQHIGMARVGNDALDRWCMAPLLSHPHLILESLMAVDPRTRANGRTWPRPLQS